MSGPNGRRFSLLFVVVSLLIPSLVLAGDFVYADFDTVMRGEIEVQKTERNQVLGRLHWLASESMSDAYGVCYSVVYQSILRERTRVRYSDKDSVVTDTGDIRPEVGLLIGIGEPVQWDDDWTIDSAELITIVIPVSSTALYNLVKGEDKVTTLYIGFGIGGYFGFERISGNVYRTSLAGEERFEWHDTSFRCSFEGHALLGTARKMGDRWHLVAELQWTQAGKGTLNRADLSEEQIQEGWDEVFNDFQHPDFSFTGASLSLGVKW